MTKSFDLLGLIITRRCPLACAHCITESGPYRREALEPALVLRLIDEAAASGVKVIAFTGGDPFVERRSLDTYVQRIRAVGLRYNIYTSAFWAKSEAAATALLKPFADVAVLGLSTDSYHQEFTALERVRNAIRAAKALDVQNLEVNVAYLDESQIESVRESLGADAEGVRLRSQKVWPVGRAARLLEGQQAALVPLQDLDLTCPMYGPVINSDGRALGCCSSLLDLGRRNPLSVADVRNDSLRAVFRKFEEHTYYNFLKLFGLKPVVQAIQDAGLGAHLKPAYTDVCHLCHHIHSTPTLRQLVEPDPTEREGTREAAPASEASVP